MDNTYPLVGFHFAVSFRGDNFKGVDARFQSVSGLDVQIQTESIKEGGENRFEHNLPTRRKYSDLILKRGVMNPQAASQMTEWCLNAFGRFGVNNTRRKNNDFNEKTSQKMLIEPVDIDIVLLNEEHEPLVLWSVIHAWPKHWKMGEFNAEKSEVLIETIELNYNRFEYSIP